MTYKVWTTLVVIALVAVLGTGAATPRPAQANDLGAILAGAAVGYLVYDALKDSGDRYRSGWAYPGPNYDPPRGGYYGYGYGESPRRAYDRGYRDGWDDGSQYGYRRGWHSGYRTGYDDGRWDYRHSGYSPLPYGGWCY